MYFCKNCGEPYMTDEAVMCVKCGVAKGQGNNYCHNCGKPLAPDAAVCLNCGVARLVLAPPLNVAEMFYSSHGVPIEEDEEWVSMGKYTNRYRLKTATSEYKYNIKEGEQTATLNFDREVRFYANLSFDRNLWYGIGKYDMEDQWVIRARVGEPAGKRGMSLYSATGYFCKKLANYQNNLLEGNAAGYIIVDYPWPVIRLADLYLLYSEALNEAYGPSSEVYKWIECNILSLYPTRISNTMTFIC